MLRQTIYRGMVRGVRGLGALCRAMAATALCLWLLVPPAAAHFADDSVVRNILVGYEDGQTVAYQRVPLPLIVADMLADLSALPASDTGAPLFTTRTATGQAVMMSRASIDAHPQDFARRLEQALLWQADGVPVTARLRGWRLIPGRVNLPLETVAEARAALEIALPPGDVDLSTGTIEYALTLEGVPAGARIAVVSDLPPLVLRPEVVIENHFTDTRADPVAKFFVWGQLQNPVTINPSLGARIAEFIWQGVLHVVLGLDHVFLIACVALGFVGWRATIWGLTAFTVGHSATLIAAFLNYTPTSVYFIPAVETAIAASVVMTAVLAALGRPPSIPVLGGIGLLHGLGFSFVLGDILGRDAPDLIASLLAFNVGIEVGQIAIVLAVALVFRVIASAGLPVHRAVRLAALGCIGVVATYWTLTRVVPILGMVSA